MLVVGVGMDRRHEALLDPERIIKHLDQDGEAVRRAGRVGNDKVPLRIEGVLIDANDECGVDSLAGCRDDHSPRSGMQVGGSLVTTGEPAGAFQ